MYKKRNSQADIDCLNLQSRISVTCPDGWYAKTGVCMKMIEQPVGFSKTQARIICEENGGYVIDPFNEMHTMDIEDYLSNSTDINATNFWIGKLFTRK